MDIIYLQSRFDGFVVLLDALADGARVKEQDDDDFGRTHILLLLPNLFLAFLFVYYIIINNLPGLVQNTIGVWRISSFML